MHYSVLDGCPAAETVVVVQERGGPLSFSSSSASAHVWLPNTVRLALAAAVSRLPTYRVKTLPLPRVATADAQSSPCASRPRRQHRMPGCVRGESIPHRIGSPHLVAGVPLLPGAAWRRLLEPTASTLGNDLRAPTSLETVQQRTSSALGTSRGAAMAADSTRGHRRLRPSVGAQKTKSCVSSPFSSVDDCSD